MSNDIQIYLQKFTEADWLGAVEELLPFIHEVDRNAVQIWFRFNPLALARYIDAAEDRETALREFALQGDFELKNRIDTSHGFLYGHRYWSTVKRKIEQLSEDFAGGDASLTETVKELAMQVSEKVAVERNLINAIAVVGLATLNQVGLEAFKAAPGEVEKQVGIMSKSPEAIIAERSRDDSQGLLGFLKTVNKKFSVIYDNLRSSGKFRIMSDQEIASASATYRTGEFKEEDDRCWEGVVPVECVSASCGTCWVGVLGGQEKLSEVSRRERRAMKVFGYGQPEEPQPFLRLACQAKASGNVSIVIPPWNAVFGKKIHGDVENIELEPNTTSAKRLREIIASAASGE